MDWMPDFVWNNWGGWMSFFADERVEDIGSILMGFSVASMVYATLNPLILLFMRRKWWYVPLAVVIVACGLVGYVVTYYVHGYWTAYQVWFTKPLGPGLEV